MKNKKVYLTTLKLISRKDYSEEELKDKLISVYTCLSDIELNQIIEELKKKKYLDDFKLASFILEKFLKKKKGYHYIISILKYRQINKEVINSISENFDYFREFEVAKKFFTEKSKTKNSFQILRILGRRGFSTATLEKISAYFIEPEGEYI